ncbi:MAG TPA: FecR domain-containing protein [Dokdonella sp.]|uniref:FecR domain-containing protein n=1 Tax=Dokdonella sp. TaxID=2291710 RepID=UPI002D805864|nr:FecR domain-containing protein [Dokdonella sp.]HET9032861.1 FecR domain-containing protein [Dokdonella sp.]
MNHDHDPLWDPSQPADAELRRMENLLASYRLRPTTLNLAAKPRVSRRASLRRWLPALAAGILLALSIPAWLQYRLAWQDGRAWQATTAETGGHPEALTIAPGNSVTTTAGQTATITVARIGSVRLSPDSTLRLVETRAGRHRVSLAHGHLRARIWAPPGYFGVASGAAEVVDLGCDFDLWKQADGHGRVYVHSGWIAYEAADRQILVPAGFEVHFDPQQVSTPIRRGAGPALQGAVGTLEIALAESGENSTETLQAASDVAAKLEDADAFTALSLLTRYPKLAATALYPRLARALGASADDASHHAAWVAGDHDAINAWWQRIPTPPKRWWANWRDAFN